MHAQGMCMWACGLDMLYLFASAHGLRGGDGHGLRCCPWLHVHVHTVKVVWCMLWPILCVRGACTGVRDASRTVCVHGMRNWEWRQRSRAMRERCGSHSACTVHAWEGQIAEGMCHHGCCLVGLLCGVLHLHYSLAGWIRHRTWIVAHVYVGRRWCAS